MDFSTRSFQLYPVGLIELSLSRSHNASPLEIFLLWFSIPSSFPVLILNSSSIERRCIAVDSLYLGSVQSWAMASISLQSCPVIDSTLGPWADSCRGGLDFTLLFEETILTILPLAAIICLIPLRIFYLSKKSVKVTKGVLLPAKVVSVVHLSSQYTLFNLLLLVGIYHLRSSRIGTSYLMEHTLCSEN